jgi:hypothetical protein
MRFYFAVSLLFLSADCFGQKLLFHKNRFREVTYQVGDIISFNLKGDNSKITSQIRGFEDKLIVFSDFNVTPEEVSHIYIDRKTKTWFILRYKYQYVLPIIGFGYALLDFANTGELSKETLLFGSSCIAAGLLAKVLISKKIKIKGKRKLVILR